MVCDAVLTQEKAVKKPGVAGYYIAIVISILLLYFFNNMRFLNLSFIPAENFISCLWAINLALSAGIIGNFVLLLYRPRWFHHLMQGLIVGLGGFAVYIVFKIFPFTFSSTFLNSGTRNALISLMTAASIAFIIEMVKFLLALRRERQIPDCTQ